MRLIRKYGLLVLLVLSVMALPACGNEQNVTDNALTGNLAGENEVATEVDVELDATANVGVTTIDYPSSWSQVKKDSDMEWQIVSPDNEATAYIQIFDIAISNATEMNEFAEGFVSGVSEDAQITGDCTVDGFMGKNFTSTLEISGKHYVMTGVFVSTGTQVAACVVGATNASFDSVLESMLDSFGVSKEKADLDISSGTTEHEAFGVTFQTPTKWEDTLNDNAFISKDPQTGQCVLIQLTESDSASELFFDENPTMRQGIEIAILGGILQGAKDAGMLASEPDDTTIDGHPARMANYSYQGQVGVFSAIILDPYRTVILCVVEPESDSANSPDFDTIKSIFNSIKIDADYPPSSL